MHAAAIKTLIVDDEPPARELIATLLRDEPGIEVVGQSANGRQAIEDIERLSPDLVFLDVQMPGIDGFGVLEAARPEHSPDVVFVTAFNQHAVRAFEKHAVDYLLKPFEYDRLREAVRRIRERRDANRHRALYAALQEARASDTHWDRIAVRDGRRVVFLSPAAIECIEAEQNYVRLHVDGKSHLLHETMNGIEQRLTDRKFVRVSRSALVNLEQVRELESESHGDATVVLHSGRRVSATRSYRDRFDAIIAALR